VLSRFSDASSFEPRVTNGSEPIRPKATRDAVLCLLRLYRQGWAVFTTTRI